jgi:hypothetical protein
MSRWLGELRPTVFLTWAISAIVASRLVVIFLTPIADQNIDLSIYLEVGELVSNGVDPYDFSSQASLREKLRLNDKGASDYVKRTPAGYDYYVSGNLPGSTALYGLLGGISDNPKVWRIAFIFGDVSIALAAFFFLRRIGISLLTSGQKLTFAAAVVAYPSLIEWGTFWPADKQFQTALMLLVMGLLLTTPKFPFKAAMAIGIAGCLSVFFKALGVFLLPLAIAYFYRRPWRETAVAAVAFLATTIPFLAFFKLSFVQLMINRVLTGSAAAAVGHGSPWVFVPASWLPVARPLVCVTLFAMITALYWRGKIDLLNGMAASMVVFLCLWTLGGSMDRMNIAMMFALMCIAALSVQYWQYLTFFNFAIQVPIYGYYIIQAPVYLHYYSIPHFPWFFDNRDLEPLDAIATGIFLMSYFCLLLIRPQGRASSQPA